MRWAADDAAGPSTAGREAGRGPLGPAFTSPTSSSLDGVWSLLAELYERPLEGDIQRAPAPAAAGSSSSSSLPPVGVAAVPRGFSDADNWQLLLWAALLCAQDWHRAQTTGSVEAASRYQESTRSP